ncbi:hypothetical protein GOP47_0001494 [Adiantum capillus-veneris]|uniref:[histone H3]-lysine(4) N-trimethyltransferase n=1 Tax=Adiantum capillus-veneris TaxID=13818 RepID=A0A9D4V8D0_ADICA|nr:hypothetical protein GOP47_0001494 [Adiantum capillus-veneris]
MLLCCTEGETLIRHFDLCWRNPNSITLLLADPGRHTVLQLSPPAEIKQLTRAEEADEKRKVAGHIAQTLQRLAHRLIHVEDRRLNALQGTNYKEPILEVLRHCPFSLLFLGKPYRRLALLLDDEKTLSSSIPRRHPIRVDKSRAVPAGNDRQITGSTQLSFHKIYRQKRCYSNFDKGKEGYSSSQWKSDCGNSSREAVEPRYSAGHNGFKSTRRTDYKETIKSTSPSLLPSSTGSAKSDRDFPKRSFDRFSRNFSSGIDFDVPVVKKQKVEHCRSSAPQYYATPEFDHNEQKSFLDETKWMYKNQHAKMSGPYGVKQLMEGFHSRFLQEDLPIYQLLEGKLCEPITLKQLMDDVQQSPRESGRRHSNQSMPSQRFPQVLAEDRAASDDDLPPGFGGRCSRFSQKSTRDYSPTSMLTVTGPGLPVHGFSSSGSDYEDTDLYLPPGFEGGPAIESHTSELCGTPQNPSLSVGVAARREGVRVMHLGYEQQEPVVHDRVHASWQGSSPHAIVGYSNQGTNTGSETSLNGHTAWAYAPAAIKIPSFEPQALSQPTVCIGLPVSKPATRSWPIASHLPSGVFNAEPYSYLNSSVLANNTLATKESIEFSERQSPDPLSLILSELLAAVKRTYIRSVLSALIGEQLDCWLDANKHWIGRVLSSDKDSPTRGACCMLSKPEVGMCNMEARVSPDEASVSAEAGTLHVEASTATTGCPNFVSEAGNAQGSEGSWLANHAGSLGENQQLLSTHTRNDANLCHAVGVVGAPLSSNAHNNVVGASKMSPSSGKSVTFSLGPDKVGSSLSSYEACKMSSKLSSSMGNETSQIFSVPREERQRKSDAITSRRQSSGNTSDAVQLEAKPPRLAASTLKKENMKSLKQLMLITSKLRSARLKSGLSKKTGSKLLCSESPKISEIGQRNWILASEGYDGCARTSVCGLWKTDAHGDGHHVECFHIKDQSPKIGVPCMQTLTHLAGSRSAPVESLTAAAEESDVIKLTLSKLVNKRSLKVARSKIHKWGVFPAEAVEAGDFVIEYLGELVRSRIADIREERYTKSGIGSGYLLRINNECAVDATKRGGLARFINHSCDPNCYINIVTVEGLKRVLIFAKRHIQPGEEVTYDYKSVRGVLNVQCCCGSSKCLGSST